MRAMLGCAAVLALCFSATAEDKKDEKIDAKLLVGKWEPKEKPDGLKVVLEFRKDGKATLTAGEGGKEERAEGSYALDGNRLTVAMTVAGRDEKQTITISKLTDAELLGEPDWVVSDNTTGFKRLGIRFTPKTLAAL